ncbi:hypothetical protein [Sporosarcina sp. FSL K6-3508]|uniref:hypothetical protein n=1 Tax=Sporosarcina sp. FSL K6-3508 TaxID=2921557 RepID=UPI00315A4517
MEGILNIGSQLLSDQTDSLNSNIRYLILYKKNGERFEVIGRNDDKKCFPANIFKVENKLGCYDCLILIPIYPFTNKLSYSTPVVVSMSSICGYQWICPSEMNHFSKRKQVITIDEDRLEMQHKKTNVPSELFDVPAIQAKVEIGENIIKEASVKTEGTSEASVRIYEREAAMKNPVEPGFQVTNIMKDAKSQLDLPRSQQEISELKQKESLHSQCEPSEPTTIIPFDKIKTITLKCERKE